MKDTAKQRLWEDYAIKYNKVSSAMQAAGIDHTLLRPLLDSYAALKNYNRSKEQNQSIYQSQDL